MTVHASWTKLKPAIAQMINYICTNGFSEEVSILVILYSFINCRKPTGFIDSSQLVISMRQRESVIELKSSHMGSRTRETPIFN